MALPLDNREKLLEDLSSELAKDKEFGPGLALRWNSPGLICDAEKMVSTGCTPLDYAVGFNQRGAGLPVGRIIEIYGESGHGKSTIAMHIFKSVQQQGGIGVYIDSENALNKEYAAKIGVDGRYMEYENAGYLEQAFKLIEETIFKIRAKDRDIPVVLIVDSLSALPPKAELESEYEDMQMGLHARMMSKAMRKITQIVGQQKVWLVLLSQVRSAFGQYGPSLTSIGGRAVIFHASVRIYVRQSGWLETGEKKDRYGMMVTAEVVKNRMGAPFRRVTFPMFFEGGIQDHYSWLERFIQKGIVVQSGAWYKYKSPEGEEKSVQGIEKFQRLLDEPETREYFRKLLVKSYFVEVEAGTIDAATSVVEVVEAPPSTVQPAAVPSIVQPVPSVTPPAVPAVPAVVPPPPGN